MCESVVLVVQTLPAAVRNLASRLKRVVAQHPLTYFFVSSATGTTSPCFKEIGIIRFPSEIFAVDVHILSYKAQSWKKTSFLLIEVISRLLCNTLSPLYVLQTRIRTLEKCPKKSDFLYDELIHLAAFANTSVALCPKECTDKKTASCISEVKLFPNPVGNWAKTNMAAPYTA